MQIKDLFLNKEQCKHLQELGLNMLDAAFCWFGYKDITKNYDLRQFDAVYEHMYTEREDIIKTLKDSYPNNKIDVIPTYTEQEIREKLPEGIQIKATYYDLRYISWYGIGYYIDSVGTDRYDQEYSISKPYIAFDSYYELLCWALEHGWDEESIKDRVLYL